MTVDMLPYHHRDSLPTRYRLAAAAGLFVAVATIRAPFWITHGAGRIGRALCRRRASLAQAQLLVAAAHWASRTWPGRTACLETALTAFYAGVLLGAAPDCCIGARFHPSRTHAWVEVDGVPVGESEELDHWAFQPLVKI